MKTLAIPLRALCAGPIARGAIQGAVIKCIGLGISFILAILAARVLGVAGYGVAAVAISLAQVAAALALFGLGPLAVRVIARLRAADEETDLAAFVAASTRWVTVAAIAMGAALAAGAACGLVHAAYRTAVMIGGVAVLPLALLQLQRGIAQGLGRISVAQIPGEVLRPGFVALVLLVAAGWGWSLDAENYLALFAAATFAAAAIALSGTLRGTAITRSAFVRARLAHWRGDALPFFGIAIAGMLQSEIATLLLSGLSTSEEVGLFQPVARLAPLIALPMNVVAMSYTPRFAELWQTGFRERARAATWTFTVVTFSAGVLVFLVTVLLSSHVFALFGAEFVAGSSMLPLLAAAQLFMAACGPGGAILTMIGHPRHALIALSAGVVLQFGVGLALIPAHGALGAAIAVSLGTVATWVLMALWARRTSGFDPSILAAASNLRAVRRFHREARDA